MRAAAGKRLQGAILGCFMPIPEILQPSRIDILLPFSHAELVTLSASYLCSAVSGSSQVFSSTAYDLCVQVGMRLHPPDHSLRFTSPLIRKYSAVPSASCRMYALRKEERTMEVNDMKEVSRMIKKGKRQKKGRTRCQE